VLNIVENLWAVRALSGTPLGELTVLAGPPSWWGVGLLPLP